MGIDLLDLSYRCEKEFGIKIDQSDLSGIVRHHPYSSFWNGSGTLDICVRDFVAMIEQKVESQNGNSDRVFERVEPLIGECLSVEEAEITLDSWLCGDLGMS